MCERVDILKYLFVSIGSDVISDGPSVMSS